MTTMNPNPQTSSPRNHGRRVVVAVACIGAVAAAAVTALAFGGGQSAPAAQPTQTVAVATQTAVTVSSATPVTTKASQPSASATSKSQLTVAASPTAPAPRQTSVVETPVSAPTTPAQPTETAPAPQPTQLEPTQPAPQPTQHAPAPQPSAAMDPLAQQLFDDMNARRVANGLAPMRANATLVTIASVRAQDMVDQHYFSHVSPGSGDDVYTLLDRYGVNYVLAGENLATNTLSGSACVQRASETLWSSPVHRGNMLSATFTDIGIAHAVDAAGNSYFVMVFAAF